MSSGGIADYTSGYNVGFNFGHRKAISTILARARRLVKATPDGVLAARLIKYLLTMDTRYNARGKKGPGR